MGHIKSGLYEYFVEFLNDMINNGRLYVEEHEVVFDYEGAKEDIEDYEY